MRRQLLLALCCALVAGVLAAAPALAATPEQTYAEVFGAEARKVSATATRKDDTALAARLLATAEEMQKSPAVRALFLRKAYEFGVAAKDGYTTAVRAAKLLSEVVPDASAERDEMLLKVYELQYRFARGSDKPPAGQTLLGHLLAFGDSRLTEGDPTRAALLYRRAWAVASELRLPGIKEIVAKIKRAAAMVKLDKEISQLQRVLAAKPKNTVVARRLLMLHLSEKDDPAKALALLGAADADEVLRTCLPLAAKPIAEVPEAALVELAGWYRHLAAKASIHGRARLLLRAMDYYGRYLAAHPKEDARSLKVRMAMREVEKQLATEDAIVGGSAWFDAIAKAVKSGAYEESVLAGREDGSNFRDMPEGGGVLIGFRLTKGNFSGPMIKSLQPIFLTSKGRVLGKMHGNPNSPVHVVEAREGYAVGGAFGGNGVRLHGLRVVFMKIQGLRLNPQSLYLSKWYSVKDKSDVTKMGCTGQFVVGIVGRQGADVGNLRLILAKDLTR